MSITFAPTTVGGPEVNMTNRNAAQVLDLLGLTFDGDWGEAPAEDFLGRVLLAQGLLDIATDDEHGHPEVRDGNWIECGRRPGYLAGRLTDLHKTVTWAIKHHTTVGWS